MNKLNSNSPYNGKATSVWVNISVDGVMKPAIINTMTITHFLFFFRNVGDRIPILVRKKTKTGSSNTSPMMSVSIVTFEI